MSRPKHYHGSFKRTLEDTGTERRRQVESVVCSYQFMSLETTVYAKAGLQLKSKHITTTGGILPVYFAAPKILSMIMPVIWYGSAFEAGRRSSK